MGMHPNCMAASSVYMHLHVTMLCMMCQSLQRNFGKSRVHFPMADACAHEHAASFVVSAMVWFDGVDTELGQ